MSSIYCQPCDERRLGLPGSRRCDSPTCPNFKQRPDKPLRRAFKGIAGGKR